MSFFWSRLFVLQRNSWIGSRGAPGWDVAGKCRNDDEQNGDSESYQRIGRADFTELAGQKARWRKSQNESARNADNRERQAARMIS